MEETPLIQALMGLLSQQKEEDIPDFLQDRQPYPDPIRVPVNQNGPGLGDLLGLIRRIPWGKILGSGGGSGAGGSSGGVLGDYNLAGNPWAPGTTGPGKRRI